MNSTRVTVPTDHDEAIVEIAPARAGDCISDKLAEEMKRRFLVFTVKPDQQIVRSQTPPTDKTVYWLPVDQNGKVIGVLQGYDAASGAWIPVSSIGQCISQDPLNLLTLDSEGCMIVAAGNVPGYAEANDKTLTATAGAADVDITYAGFLDIDAEIGVNFTGDPGAGSRWWVTARAETGCRVNFAGLGGTVGAKIFARRTTVPTL